MGEKFFAFVGVLCPVLGWLLRSESSMASHSSDHQQEGITRPSISALGITNAPSAWAFFPCSLSYSASTTCLKHSPPQFLERTNTSDTNTSDNVHQGYEKSFSNVSLKWLMDCCLIIWYRINVVPIDLGGYSAITAHMWELLWIVEATVAKTKDCRSVALL